MSVNRPGSFGITEEFGEVKTKRMMDFLPVPEDMKMKFPWVFLMKESLVSKLRWLEEWGTDPIEYLSAALEEKFEKDERFKEERP